jgi:hypothetical protein
VSPLAPADPHRLHDCITVRMTADREDENVSWIAAGGPGDAGSSPDNGLPKLAQD